MATNDFLPFANGGGANVLTQAQYAALTTLLSGGYQSGVANSAQMNKTWRQSSIMAAVLGQFIANTTGQNAIDDGTTATLLANLTAAVSATSPVVIGSARNLAMSVTAASATATLTADQIVVASALNGQTYMLPSFSKTINLATTGAGGMDTGTAPVSGYVALYAIWNPTTQTAALLARDATSVLQPNVYGGANMPAGYTASALVSVWPTNSSSQFSVGLQTDRKIGLANTTVLNSSTIASTPTALSIAGTTPKNARSVFGVIGTFAGSAQANVATQLYSTPGSIGFQDCAGTLPSGCGVFANFILPLSTPQTIYYTTSLGAGTGPLFTIIMCGYEI